MLFVQSAMPEKITLEDLLAVEPLAAPVLSPAGTRFDMSKQADRLDAFGWRLLQK
jgi:hypothetical protein